MFKNGFILLITHIITYFITQQITLVLITREILSRWFNSAILDVTHEVIDDQME